MFEIKLSVSNIDYDALAEVLTPLLADSLAEKGGLAAAAGSNPKLMQDIVKLFLHKKGVDGTEKLLSRLALKKKQLIIEKLEGAALQKGVSVHIDDIEIIKR